VKEKISISLSGDLLEIIDQVRGITDRSSFIEALLKGAVEEYRKKRKEG
jgi:metal-responsive CopG/Arc/MetJ family transcriptional regulator